MTSPKKTSSITDGTQKQQSVEWPTIAMLALAYASWAGAGFLLFPQFPVVALAVMAVMAALHSSLQHEALHGHPTRNAALNELLVSLPLAGFFPYRRFKTLHLRHHCDERLTDPYDDPESWFHARGDVEKMSPALRFLLEVNNSFLGRLTIGPALMVVAFMNNEWSLLRHGKPEITRAWVHHLLGLAVLFVIVAGGMGIPIWLYVLAVSYVSLSLISIRTYCEHQWAEDSQERSIIVEKSGLLSWLFLNNNLHLVHHALPRAPWYELPKLYWSRRGSWIARNGGYVYSSYWQILFAFALERKDPLSHPAWHRIGQDTELELAHEDAGQYHPTMSGAAPVAGKAEAVPARPNHR